MANNHGGKRLGAGRKKMSDAQRQLLGLTKPVRKAKSEMTLEQQAKQEGYFEENESALKAMELHDVEITDEPIGVEMPQPNDYLIKEGKAGRNRGVELYEKLWKWLVQRDCHLLVNTETLQQYCLSVVRHEQAEELITAYGFVSKHPTTGAPIESPWVKVSDRFQRQAQSLWASIWINIAERIQFFVDKNAKSDDPLDNMLNNAVIRAARGKK